AAPAPSSGPRYSWMRYLSGWMRQRLGRYEEARQDLSAVLESRPELLPARGHLAETLPCLGLEREAFSQFEAESRRDPDTLAWHGELLLWRGRYREAVSRLDEAFAGRAWTAACWRGAAKLLLGDLDSARRDLDRAVEARDPEAFLWRGELFR